MHPHVHTCTHTPCHASMCSLLVAFGKVSIDREMFPFARTHTHTHTHTQIRTHTHTHTTRQTHTHTNNYANTHTYPFLQTPTMMSADREKKNIPRSLTMLE